MLRTRFQQQLGVSPSPEEEASLVDYFVEEELLYREALARGLDRHDRAVRQRLIEKMRVLAEPGTEDAELLRQALALGLDRDDVVIRRLLIRKLRLLATTPPPGDQLAEHTLRDYLARHAARYRRPALATFSHVFLSPQARGPSLDADALDLAAKLRADATAPVVAVTRGDAFPLGHHFRARSRYQIAKLFGDPFAAAVLALEPGRWSEPIASAQGRHLVYVEELQAARPAELEEVRSQVVQGLRAEIREQRREELVTELRRGYDVVIETGGNAGGTTW